MRKRFCLLPVLALALLCACSKGAAKTPPTRPADFTSTERQFNTPADGHRRGIRVEHGAHLA